MVGLAASAARVTPAEQHFEWNGRMSLAPFVVSVDPDARTGDGAVVDLCFSVSLAGVPIASVPLPVRLVSDGSGHEVQMPAGVPTPGQAFASYSAKDAETVGHCLSALSRWLPDFRCVQDCLDLRPNESFKADIRALIDASDRFILFWSRHASASPWVRWEYDIGRRTLGVDAMVPMPLEDPSIAPPPPERAHRHMRDRFMLARHALRHLSTLTAGPGPGPG